MKLFVQILKGLKAIHEKNFVHRDIKTNNIVLHNNVAKIADFGLSKSLN